MKQLQTIVSFVTKITKYALIGVAFVKALEVFNEELKKIDISDIKEDKNQEDESK